MLASTTKFNPSLQSLLTKLIKKTDNCEQEDIHRMLLKLQDAPDDSTLIHQAALQAAHFDTKVPQELQEIIDTAREYYLEKAQAICEQVQTEIHSSSTDPSLEQAFWDQSENEEILKKIYSTDRVINRYRKASFSFQIDGNCVIINSPDLSTEIKLTLKNPVTNVSSSLYRIIQSLDVALNSQSCGCGNCGEMARLCFFKIMQLEQFGFNVNCAIYRLKNDTSSSEEIFKSADHAFVVVNPPPNLFAGYPIDYKELAKLYPASFVIDPIVRNCSQRKIFSLESIPDLLANRVVFNKNWVGFHTPLFFGNVPTTIPEIILTSEECRTHVESYEIYTRQLPTTNTMSNCDQKISQQGKTEISTSTPWTGAVDLTNMCTIV